MSLRETASDLVSKASSWKPSFIRSQEDEHGRKLQWTMPVGFKTENFVPGFVAGLIIGLLLEIPRNIHRISRRPPKSATLRSDGADENDVKMVFVVRQDLKMGAGKIASQCAHAATGIYGQLMLSQRALLYKWEQCGQPKIVVTCKNQRELNNLQAVADNLGLPTFMVSDAGRTQVAAGSKTVLAVGPGKKAVVDSVTGKLRLL